MNILQVTNRLPFPLNDGGNIATYHVTRLLSRHGHQVTLASLNTKKHYHDPDALSGIARVYTTFLDTTHSMQAMIKGFRRPVPFNIEKFDVPAFRDQLRMILQKEKFDIIQIEGIYLSTYIDLFREYSDAKIVLRSHNLEYQIWKRMGEHDKNIFRKIYLKYLSGKIRKFELESMHKYDGIVAITEEDGNYYREAGYKKKLKVINAGVDLETVKPSGEKPRVKSVCFLGSLEWLPNRQGLLWFLDKVWPRLLRMDPSLEMHIAGKNPPAEISRLKKKGVTVHGMVPDAVDFLNSCQILIVPLLSGGGMRLKIIEAMALGKCVVSTRVGAEGIDIQDGENILLADDPDEFVEKILLACVDEEIREKIGRNAMKLVHEKYDWEKLVREFENFYLELL